MVDITFDPVMIGRRGITRHGERGTVVGRALDPARCTFKPDGYVGHPCPSVIEAITPRVADITFDDGEPMAGSVVGYRMASARSSRLPVTVVFVDGCNPAPNAPVSGYVVWTLPYGGGWVLAPDPDTDPDGSDDVTTTVVPSDVLSVTVHDGDDATTVEPVTGDGPFPASGASTDRYQHPASVRAVMNRACGARLLVALSMVDGDDYIATVEPIGTGCVDVWNVTPVPTDGAGGTLDTDQRSVRRVRLVDIASAMLVDDDGDVPAIRLASDGAHPDAVAVPAPPVIPSVGDRVVFTMGHDAGGFASVPVGTNGTVHAIGDDTIDVMPDDPAIRAALADWDGCVVFSMDDGYHAASGPGGPFPDDADRMTDTWSPLDVAAYGVWLHVMPARDDRAGGRS